MLKSTEKKRVYCSVCSEYRGKLVNDKPVTLHRFPADRDLFRLWTKRVKSIMPTFNYTKNSRICSTHFVNGEMSTANNIPAVFLLSSGRKKLFGTTSTKQNIPTGTVQSEIEVKPENDIEDSEPITEYIDSSDQEEVVATNYNSCGGSALQTSVMLHDYCGSVERELLSKPVNKCEQTDASDSYKPLSIKTFADASTQCSIDLKSTLVQTDSSVANSEIQMCSVGIQTSRPDISFEDIQHTDEKVMFYTGLPNAGTFHALFDEMSDAVPNTQRRDSAASSRDSQGRPRALQLVEEFFMVLIRLRLGLLLDDLAGRFHISKSTCGCIVSSRWIDYLHVKLTFLTPWPSLSTIQNTMPRKFKKRYPRCRVIIDCTEIFTETPQSLCNKTLMYSHYKTHMTYKALLGTSPSGIITFASDLWGGSISDKQITKNSGLLELCERGDAIMADKGFVISDLTTPKGIHLIIPPFKHKRFSRREIEETRRIANLRIDVERAMERVKNFRILQGTMPINLSSQASKIWKLCVHLSNLQPPLIHDETD